MRILAIDPGYDRLGLAVVEGTASRPIVVWSDCILPPKGTQEDRLSYIYNAIEEAVTTYKPTMSALEGLFFSTNKKTAIKVAESRGAILSALGAHALVVQEYAPGTIKVAVTGNGRADKKAIARMIPLLVSIPVNKRFDDELDAIAVGITALSHYRDR